LNLMCARFEAALSEGAVDTALRAHEQSCERCADFSRELARVQALIADATGPADSLSDDFLDQVLLRADALDGRFGEHGPRAVGRSLSGLAVVVVAAAAVLVAFWAGGAREQLRQVDTRSQVRVAAPAPTPPTAQDVAAVPTESMARLPATASAVASTRARIEPVVPAAAPVPEPVVDLGAEIQVMLRERVTQSEGCPAHTKVPVWVTATVQTDGSLTDRSVMSAGSASEAHRCVSRALDQLLLPPGMPVTTVTFELSW
jgi:hypothetical protein